MMNIEFLLLSCSIARSVILGQQKPRIIHYFDTTWQIFSLLSLTLFTSISWTKEPEAKLVLLARGEQQEIVVKELKNFSIGNKEILTALHRPKEKKLYIKGKAIGAADLWIWSKRGKITKYMVFVISKAEQLKRAQAIDLIKGSSLELTFKGDQLFLSGQVSKIEEWRIMQLVRNLGGIELSPSLGISREFKQKLLLQVYEAIYRFGIHQFSCHFTSVLEIYCEHPAHASPEGDQIASLQHYLKQQYLPVKWVKFDRKAENLKLQFKFIVLGQQGHRAIAFGLQSGQTTVGRLWADGLGALINDNPVMMRQLAEESSFFSLPELFLLSKKKAQLQWGEEIFFQQLQSNNTNSNGDSSWKFSGLALELEAVPIDLMTYQLNFICQLAPGTSSAQGTAAIQKKSYQASQLLTVGQPTLLLKLRLGSQDQGKMEYPWLSQIPLLGHLFRQKINTNQYQELLMMVQLDR